MLELLLLEEEKELSWYLHLSAYFLMPMQHDAEEEWFVEEDDEPLCCDISFDFFSWKPNFFKYFNLILFLELVVLFPFMIPPLLLLL
jgi:hypothetical protein